MAYGAALWAVVGAVAVANRGQLTRQRMALAAEGMTSLTDGCAVWGASRAIHRLLDAGPHALERVPDSRAAPSVGAIGRARQSGA